MQYKKNSLVVNILLITTTIVFLEGCGTTSSDNSSDLSTQDGSYLPKGNTYKVSKVVANADYMTVVFNGFSGNASQYRSPNTLAEDLSAIHPANLYLYYYYTQQVQPGKTPKNYKVTLPASKLTIDTGLTLLPPSSSMNSSSSEIAALKGKLVPTASNPVFLSIPPGRESLPETPFFPAGARYSAVLIESPLDTTSTNTSIVSIETSAINPVILGAFAHHPDKELKLRFYDNTSTIDAKMPNVPLLTDATTSLKLLKARFLSLTDDNLPAMSLHSIDQTDFGNLGFNSGVLLTLMHKAFPKLIKVNGDDATPIFNPKYGIFCLGGNNTFQEIRLTDQAFVYPVSSADKNTHINTVNISNDSGFITESGKHINIETIDCKGTLKLIAVMDEPADAQPIVRVQKLNGANKINVVIGRITPTFSLLSEGMVLLSHDNDIPAPSVIHTEDAHIAGSFYDGESEYRNKQIILTSLRKTGSLSSGALNKLLAEHPVTQGLTRQEMRNITLHLDPIQSTQYTAGALSSAAMAHTINLNSLNPNPNTKQNVIPLSNILNIASSNEFNATIVSTNLMCFKNNKVGVVASMYGATSQTNDTTASASITAFAPFVFNQFSFIPSISTGYSISNFSDINYSYQGIDVSLSETVLNSLFARLMAIFNYKTNNVNLSVSAGIESRYSSFAKGDISSNYSTSKMTGESFNSYNSILEATFSPFTSIQTSCSMRNFNQVQLQVSITY